MQHHSPLQSGSCTVSERNWADRICSTTNCLDSSRAEIPEMQQPCVFFREMPQQSIERTFLQCTIPKQTHSLPYHSSQLWEVWNKHFLGFFFQFVLVLFYSHMSLKCLGTYAYSINTFGWCQKWDTRAFWRKTMTMWYPNGDLKMWRPRLACGSRGRKELL